MIAARSAGTCQHVAGGICGLGRYVNSCTQRDTGAAGQEYLIFRVIIKAGVTIPSLIFE